MIDAPELPPEKCYIRFRGGTDPAYVLAMPKCVDATVREFAVREYGTPAVALSAATTWRDDRLPPRYLKAVAVAEREGCDPRPQWDEPGVGMIVDKNEIKGFHAWGYDTAGKQLTAGRFPVEVGNWQAALRQAVEARRDMGRRFWGDEGLMSTDDWVEVLSFGVKAGRPKTGPLDLSNIDHPGTINKIQDNGWQAALNRSGRRWTKYFAWKEYGGSPVARAAAMLWLFRCDEHLKSLGVIRQRTRPSEGGISRFLKRRTKTGEMIVTYGVAVKVDGRSRRLEFEIGPVDSVTDEQESFTSKLAMACRREFLQSEKKGVSFDRKRWVGWKKKYGFPGQPCISGNSRTLDKA